MSLSSVASGAYKATANLAKAGLSPSEGQGKGGFADLVTQALGQFQREARANDTRTEALAAGKADLIDVVTAVAETQVAVESMVAVRDKVVAAYDEIMKMAI